MPLTYLVLLAFTKEAALVRSILNASMMYLVAKHCTETNQISCGCRYSHRSIHIDSAIHKLSSHFQESTDQLGASIIENEAAIDRQDLSEQDLSKLEAGSPLRLTKHTIRHRGKTIL